MTYSKLGKDTKTDETVNLYKTSRRQGTYVIAATGVGKSTSLRFLIEQDIKQGIGVCVFDPHGDLINDIIGSLHRKEDRDRVILLDAQDQNRVFGINLYQCDNPRDKKAVEDTVERVRHLIELLWPDISTQPLVSQGIRNSSYAFIDSSPVYGCTMLELPLLFGIDRSLRANIVSHLQDSNVAQWWARFEDFNQEEQAKRSDMVVNKIEEYTTNRLLQPIIGQSNSTIDFRKVIDSTPGNIVLVRMYGDNERMTQLIGGIVIAQLLNAALSRQDTEREKRRQFHIYCDEFELYATDDFTRLLKECRKYGMGMTIAHQSREGISLRNKAASLQVANIIVGRVIPDDAKDLAPLFKANPRPGEREYKPIMQRQYRREYQTVWEPPEAEAQYHQVCLQLTALTGCLHVLQSCGIPSFSLSQSPEELEIESAKAIAEFTELQNSEAAFSLYAFYNPDFTQVDFANDCIPIPSSQQQLVLSGEQAQAFTFARSIPLPIDKELEKWMSAYGPSMHPETDKINAAVRAYVTHLQAQIHSILAPFQTNAVYLMIPYAPHGLEEEALFLEKLDQERARRSRQRGFRLFRTKNSEIKRSDKSYDWYNHQRTRYEVQKSDRAWDLRRKLSYMEYVDAKEAFWRVHAYPILLDWLKDQLSQLLAEIKPVLAEEKRLSACQKTKEVEIDLGYSYTVEDVFAHEELRGRYHVTVTDARKTRYEERPGSEEPIHNARERLEEELSHLPVGVAWCRVQNAAGELEEHVIKLAMSTTRLEEKHKVGQWIEEIKGRMLNVDKTLRPITDVEQEIADRHTRLRQSQAQTQQPPPASRKALLCSSCGFSNRQGANFCNQCGAKL